MKYMPPALISYLNSGGVFTLADLFTLTLQPGTVLRWTNSDINLSYGGNSFQSVIDQGGIPLVRRGAIRNVRGTEVGTMDLTLLTGGTANLSGTNMCLAAHNGAFDAARVRVERCYMPSPGDTSLGTVCLFEGNNAGTDPGSTQVVLHVKSDLEILQQQMPRVLFQPGCANSFGDSACGINLASLTLTGTVLAGSTSSVLNLSIAGGAANAYANGVLVMTSGVANGSRRTISASAAGNVTLTVRLPFTPSAGDTFSLYPGCARTRAACASYSNSNNYQGFPFVPEASTSL
jgi:uncharacterized phage protein (TIGR02218 family)